VPPVVEVHLPPASTPPPVENDGRPAWAAEPFECLLFDVAGLTLAVPLVCLGSIYPLAGHELTSLFGQPDWFLGILPSQAGNLKVLDTARWVMPDRYREDFKQGLQYVISVQGYEWGLAVHQVSRSLRLDPNEIKWRSHRGQRPWLAGTVIEHMCALLDVSELAELIASGGARHMGGSKPAHKPT
jgi:purine-binding chemotaxis protein CheW